jgi:hypothetical protein
MEKYLLALKNTLPLPEGKWIAAEGRRIPSPNYMVIEDIEGSRIPAVGETFNSNFMTDYIHEVAQKQFCHEYVDNFAHSNFVVEKVEHVPRMIEGKLVSIPHITAIKIQN